VISGSLDYYPKASRHELSPLHMVVSATVFSMDRICNNQVPLWHTGWLNFAARPGAAWMADGQSGPRTGDTRRWRKFLRHIREGPEPL
jgi:hypothetical protein